MKKLVNNSGLCITALGLITSVGQDANTACASIQEGEKNPTNLENFYVDSPRGHEDWEDGFVTGHPVLKGYPDQTENRIFILLASALQDLFNATGEDKALLEGTPLYVALPEEYRTKTDQERLQAQLAENPDLLPFSCGEIVPFYQGHAAMILALAQAGEAIAAGQGERAIIAGADSLIGFADLSMFNKAERLKTVLNPDGFMPGEGGSAVLVETIKAAENRKADIGAVIDRISTDHEADNVLSGSDATGNGLVNVISALNRDAEAAMAPDTIITDMNGEFYRAKELGNIYSRTLGDMLGEQNMNYPAKSLGDTGAAYAGIALSIAVRALAEGNIAKDKEQGDALVLASSDSGLRGAVYIRPYEDQ
uniref:3-oxoacyl-[acyl-carrier-protein] synthase domain-containing protein n=1 Tax=uncultured organism TaxID=155900 RepID=M1Q322_9ZZZZ|nr:3-oxoacyl-[acyl-carrier-protein] synthase domain-containing protein [uncultured organism]